MCTILDSGVFTTLMMTVGYPLVITQYLKTLYNSSNSCTNPQSILFTTNRQVKNCLNEQTKSQRGKTREKKVYPIAMAAYCEHFSVLKVYS